jgi:UDP-GlcNAc:undecaprenyl-phosphate GlcNAc-1-phosphate transferase
VAIPLLSFGLPILDTLLSILRRLITGRPIFVGDCDHIHHKLLQKGLSQCQVVVALYAVSAAFTLVSSFLLWPTGPMFGLVLAILGPGIWVGRLCLGFHESGKLRHGA